MFNKGFRNIIKGHGARSAPYDYFQCKSLLFRSVISSVTKISCSISNTLDLIGLVVQLQIFKQEDEMKNEAPQGRVLCMTTILNLFGIVSVEIFIIVFSFCMRSLCISF